MKVKFGLITICALLLTGCGLKKFECPYTEGVSCKSLSEVNELVNQGVQGKHPIKNKLKKEKENFFSKQSLSLVPDNKCSTEDKAPLRVPEQVLKVWLAPYETLDGLFYPEHVIYIVATASHWEGV